MTLPPIVNEAVMCFEKGQISHCDLLDTKTIEDNSENIFVER